MKIFIFFFFLFHSCQCNMCTCVMYFKGISSCTKYKIHDIYSKCYGRKTMYYCTDYRLQTVSLIIYVAISISMWHRVHVDGVASTYYSVNTFIYIYVINGAAHFITYRLILLNGMQYFYSVVSVNENTNDCNLIRKPLNSPFYFTFSFVAVAIAVVVIIV